jgi:hypothetical protein
MIIETIDLAEFKRRFEQYNRATQFSAKGFEALFAHLTGWSEDYELDVIELCGEFAEVSEDELKEESNFQIVEKLSDGYLIALMDISSH